MRIQTGTLTRRRDVIFIVIWKQDLVYFFPFLPFRAGLFPLSKQAFLVLVETIGLLESLDAACLKHSRMGCKLGVPGESDTTAMAIYR